MNHIDLNLMRTFVLLYETGSVTQTAERLYVTQPSISYALARLRDLFEDRLFVRTRQGMEPTIAARQLYPSLRDALQQLQDTIESSRDFDPATCTRRFRLALTDLGEMALLPKLMSHLHDQAPQAELEVVPLEIEHAEEWLAAGRVNALICSRPLTGAAIARHVLLRDRYVCLLNQERFGKGPLTRERFIAARHVAVTSSSGHGMAEEVMRQEGIQRKVSLEIPHFSVLPRVLHDSDLIAIMPLQVAASFTEGSPLTIHELPFHVPEFEVALHWQAQASRSPSQRWFCESIIEAIGEREGAAFTD
ncbi:LysR family transcriptional regulator [Halomonas sp. LR3S48]|uniref:LysR family transcriptional regulator n=1 Tax=Halomonas sp. LR3S48 TaxID=2982694 RepID=UPI0021E3B65D|nr:LysR family transcriptional regulator [Halomonas sp. LR3S48]UYG03383.1 LysR family transcriptional regulator [Halomonas sp. LR3S48]